MIRAAAFARTHWAGGVSTGHAAPLGAVATAYYGPAAIALTRHTALIRIRLNQVQGRYPDPIQATAPGDGNTRIIAGPSCVTAWAIEQNTSFLDGAKVIRNIIAAAKSRLAHSSVQIPATF